MHCILTFQPFFAPLLSYYSSKFTKPGHLPRFGTIGQSGWYTSATLCPLLGAWPSRQPGRLCLASSLAKPLHIADLSGVNAFTRSEAVRSAAANCHLRDLLVAYEAFCTHDRYEHTWNSLAIQLARYLRSNFFPNVELSLPFQLGISFAFYLEQLTTA
jgi:hypothetical protein